MPHAIVLPCSTATWNWRPITWSVFWRPMLRSRRARFSPRNGADRRRLRPGLPGRDGMARRIVPTGCVRRSPRAARSRQLRGRPPCSGAIYSIAPACSKRVSDRIWRMSISACGAPRSGIEGIYEPAAVAWHHGSATLGRWHRRYGTPDRAQSDVSGGAALSARLLPPLVLADFGGTGALGRRSPFGMAPGWPGCAGKFQASASSRPCAQPVIQRSRVLEGVLRERETIDSRIPGGHRVRFVLAIVLYFDRRWGIVTHGRHRRSSSSLITRTLKSALVWMPRWLTGAEVVVVDNGSHGRHDLRKSANAGARLVANAANRGFAAAVNQGFPRRNPPVHSAVESRRRSPDQPGAVARGLRPARRRGRPGGKLVGCDGTPRLDLWCADFPLRRI